MPAIGKNYHCQAQIVPGCVLATAGLPAQLVWWHCTTLVVLLVSAVMFTFLPVGVCISLQPVHHHTIVSALALSLALSCLSADSLVFVLMVAVHGCTRWHRHQVGHCTHWSPC